MNLSNFLFVYKTVSTILLWDYKAIRMHKQSGTGIEHRALVPIRHGNRLLTIAVFQLAVLRYEYTRKIVNRATTSTLTVLEEPNFMLYYWNGLKLRAL